MSFVFLIVSLVGGFAHWRISKASNKAPLSEMWLVYMLVGYCGLPQIYSGLDLLLRPDVVAAHLGVPTGNPITIWTSFLYIGAAIASTLAIWLRGIYLVAPTVVWSVFFAGATYAHLYTRELNGSSLSPLVVLLTFVTHGMISLILISCLLAQRKELRQNFGGVARPSIV